MPSDDLILNVKQIDGYPATARAMPQDAIVLQRGGLGGPYLSISPALFVGSALANGGDMAIGGQLMAAAVQAGKLQASNGSFGAFTAQKACLTDADFQWASLNGAPIADQNWVSNLIAGVRASSVWSVNGRVGDIALTIWDVRGAAPLHSPRFDGQPRAPTPSPNSCSDRLATTAFVHGSIVNYLNNFSQEGVVSSFNGRAGAIVLTAADVQAANPGYAPLDSPDFSGLPTAPTAAPGASTGQIATTAFVMNAVTESTTGVSSFNTRTGAVVLSAADLTAAGGALLVSPVFTGTPQAPTAAPGTASLQIASTAFVDAAISAAGYAPLNSPQFTGVPTAPNAALNTATAQIATTAFVMNQLTAIDAGVTTFNGRSGAVNLIANDLSAAGGALLASPVFSGNPTAPTQSPGTTNTTLATTAFVAAAVAAATGVSSFNGRTGAVTLTSADVNAASAGGPYLPLSPGGSLTSYLTIGVASPPAGFTVGATRLYAAGSISLQSALAFNAYFNASSQWVALNAGAAALFNVSVGGLSWTSNSGLTAGQTFTPTPRFNVDANGNFNVSGAFGVTATATFNGSMVSVQGIQYYLGTNAAIGFTWDQTNGYLDAVVNGNQIGNAILGAAVGSNVAPTSITVVGAQSQMVANYPGGGAIWSVSFSDRRLKSRIVEAAKDALAAIRAVPVYEYDYRAPLPGAGDEHWDWGLIAGELGPIPNADVSALPGGYASIRELPMIAALVKAVQQLAAKVEILETRLAT